MRSCRDTPGWLISTSSTRSLTERSPRRRAWMRRLRVGSARTSNTSLTDPIISRIRHIPFGRYRGSAAFRGRPSRTWGAAPVAPAGAMTTYTCPMDPEVRQEGPGDCPKCGMSLEPVLDLRDAAAAEAPEDGGELRAMMRRFWVSAALSAPLLLVAMSD